MMTKKPYSLTFVVLCLLFVVAVAPAFGVLGDPMQKSSNWAGSWEGDERPYNGGAGDWAVYWFTCDPCDQTTYEVANSSDGSNGLVTLFATATLWYQAPSPITDFNFAGGVSFEWRIKSHYGTANSGQDFFAIYDYNLDKNIRFTFTYPDGPNTYGLINLGGVDYPFPMKSSVPGNDYHKFRVTVLGSVVKLYIDDNPDEVLTGVTSDGQGSGVNGLAWGDKLMQTEFDYLRWTTEGAFAPPALPAAAPSKFSHKWEGYFEGDELPYDGGDGWWSPYWFDCAAGQETQYEIDSTAFGDLPYYSEPGNPYGAEPGNQYMNVNATVGALWYKAPYAEPFDFNTGATLEWRFKCHYGTANAGQVYVQFGDGTNTLRPTFSYPASNPYGLMKFNGGATNETSYEIYMSSSVPGNDYHTFRFVCLGDDFSLYVDNNSVPALTGTTDTRPAEQAVNNLSWGSKLMAVDFDYIRWTKAGAFPPPDDCELLWEGTLAGPEQDMNQDCSVDMLDLYEFVSVWLNCNDPAGCP